MILEPFEHIVTAADFFRIISNPENSGVLSVLVSLPDAACVNEAVELLRRQRPQEVRMPDALEPQWSPIKSSPMVWPDVLWMTPEMSQEMRREVPKPPRIEIFLSGELATNFIKERVNYQRRSPPDTSLGRQ